MSDRSNVLSRPATAAALVILLAGASSACRQDMHDAPRYDPLEASDVFPHGASAQPLIDGTVSRGDRRDDELLTAGRVNGQLADEFPFAITRTDLDRGEERFNIYCSPCHDRRGEGNGMVVQRGFRQAASFHTDRLRQAPAGYFFEVVTNGFGVMPDYRAQIPVEDRWRIIAYVRALQLSHHATTTDVPADELRRLESGQAAPPAAAPPAEHGGGPR